tara:strand:+ start:4 stop:390 length:387 start_codon:yes stop_codon:yes gene_type:complete
VNFVCSFRAIAWLYIVFGSFAVLTGGAYVAIAITQGGGDPTGASIQVFLALTLVISSVCFLKKVPAALTALKILTGILIVLLPYNHAISGYQNSTGSWIKLILYIVPLCFIFLKLNSSSAKRVVKSGE